MLKTIKEQVSKVIQYSQHIPEPQVDELIDRWFEAKRDFMEAFGGPIWEYPFPVNFCVSKDSKIRRIENLVQYINDEYGYERLCNFILDNKDSFYENTVQEDYYYKDKKIPKGSKERSRNSFDCGACSSAVPMRGRTLQAFLCR